MVYGALGGSTLHARYINNLMGSLGRWGGGERKAPVARVWRGGYHIPILKNEILFL